VRAGRVIARQPAQVAKLSLSGRPTQIDPAAI